MILSWLWEDSNQHAPLPPPLFTLIFLLKQIIWGRRMCCVVVFRMTFMSFEVKCALWLKGADWAYLDVPLLSLDTHWHTLLFHKTNPPKPNKCWRRCQPLSLLLLFVEKNKEFQPKKLFTSSQSKPHCSRKDKRKCPWKNALTNARKGRLKDWMYMSCVIWEVVTTLTVKNSHCPVSWCPPCGFMWFQSLSLS